MSYRLYLISGLTRRFEPAREITAGSDMDAIAVAEELRSNRPAELWFGNRMVKDWECGRHPDDGAALDIR